MKITKAPIVLIIMLSISSTLFSQSNSKIFDIQTETVLEFDLGRPSAGWGIDNYIFLNGSRASQFNIDNFEIIQFDYYKDVAYFYGRYENSMIIMRRSKNVDSDFQLFKYTPENSAYQKIEDVSFFLNEGEKLNKIYHYKNNEYIATYAVSGQGPVYYNTYLINAETGENTPLMKYDKVKVYDISPDKMHIIVASYRKNYIAIYNIQEKRIVSKIDFSGNPNYESSFYFINNEYVFILGNEDGVIYNLDLEQELVLNYLKPTDVPNIGISLNKIMNSNFGRYTQEGGKRILVRMPDENEIYKDNGLLFHQTTAVLNDDRVRMREWPLLDARHLAFLEDGEEVEVLDRSGIKVKIGDMEDYWYKIKRSDGQIGWSYGYFLDLLR